MNFSIPFRQGQQDALCGIYAGINSIKAVFGKNAKSGEDFKEYMDEWVRQIDDKKFKAYFLMGMNYEQLGQELAVLKKLVYEVKQQRREDSKAKGRILDICTYKVSSSEEFDKTASELLDAPDRSRCFIVRLSGRAFHWTVVTGITKEGFRTFDSCGLEELILKKLVLGEGYDPRYYYVSHEFFIVSNGKRRKKSKQ